MLDPALADAFLRRAQDGDVARAVLDAARDIAPVSEISAYRFTRAGSPIVLASASERHDARSRADLYARRFHPLDPTRATRASTGRGRGFAQSVETDEIGAGDYRALCFERPGFSGKLSFGWAAPEGCMVLSFYRHGRPAGPEQAAQLGALANLGLLALFRTSAIVPTPASLVGRLEEKLRVRCPQLTPRERQVCARTLAGLSAVEIASDLSLRRSSVLTYRQRACVRFEVRSCAEFLQKVLD